MMTAATAKAPVMAAASRVTHGSDLDCALTFDGVDFVEWLTLWQHCK